MHRLNPDVDIVAQVLDAVRCAKPDDVFCKSIQHQYMERGNLSKKQLEGLLGKALRIPGIPQGKLATLEAIIKKKVTKERAPATQTTIAEDKTADELSEKMMEAILLKYPAHKRVLLFKAKYESEKKLSGADKDELQKFYKLLIR